MGRRSPTARYWSGLCGWARLGLAEHWTVRRPTPETRSLPRRRWARTMASVGIRKRVSARPGRVTYQVWWLLDDGSQGAQTVATPAIAHELQAEKQLEIARGSWQGRRRGRLTFDRWADEWWAVWSTDPDRSRTTLAATENRLRRHIRPWFGQRPLEAIRPMLIRRWQNQLAGQVGPESLMACRSILFRILQLAEDEGAIAANPVRKVPAPKRQVDPERVFADGRSRSCRWSTPATKPVGSAVASSPGPRATPASARSPWLRWWSRRSAVSCRPMPTRTPSSLPVLAAGMACPLGHERPCRATAFVVSTRTQPTAHEAISGIFSYADLMIFGTASRPGWRTKASRPG